jgi:exopolyphosphatase/guanosine-5'-triphosphate,3'-diphosphate pyrophosphatase
VTGRVAAVDIGTNSVRLLVAELDGDGHLDRIERLMRITRLGQGVDASHRLVPEAIERTLGVLREYRDVIDRLGVERVRATATSAARDAGNGSAFIDPATEVLGCPSEVLSGDEEGRLSFRGATAELDPAGGPFLVVDIGGGSTEFTFGTTELEAVLSCDIGCVRLTEKFLHHDPPEPDELSQCLSLTEVYLHDVAREVAAPGEPATFVGLAGTITTVAAVEQGLATYDRDKIHHFHLTRPAVEDVFRTLATESREQRLWNPGLEPERADVIVGGLCVLVEIMRYYGFDECLVSEADILDGLALSLLDERSDAG